MHILKPFSDNRITSLDKALLDLANYIPEEDNETTENKKNKEKEEGKQRDTDASPFYINYSRQTGRYELPVLYQKKEYRVEIAGSLLESGTKSSIKIWDERNLKEYFQVGSIPEYFAIFETLYNERHNREYKREMEDIKKLFSAGMERNLMTLSTIKEVFPPIGWINYPCQTFQIIHHSCNGKRESDNFAFENKRRFVHENENPAIQQTFETKDQEKIFFTLVNLLNRNFFEIETNAIEDEKEKAIALSTDGGKLIIRYDSHYGVGIGMRFHKKE